MGFPSPAADYTEMTLIVNSICGVGPNTIVAETSDGFAVIDKALPAEPDSVLLANFDGRAHFVKRMGRSLITKDGEAIEGEALDEVVVIGVVTYFINRVSEDRRPV